MITIFVFIFIITGNIFGAVLFQDEYREEVDYSVGGFTEITEAQIRGKLYLPRMEKETNYSSNTIALGINSEENPAKWGEENGVPSKEQLKENYENAVLEELQTQSKIRKCSNPEVGGLEIQDGTNYTADLATASIICNDRSTQADVKLEKDSFWSNNSNNRYVKISATAVELGNHLEEKDLPKNWEEGTGSVDSGDSCKSSVNTNALRQEAREEAKEEAIKDDDLAETLIDGFSSPDWIDIETSKTFTIDYNKESENSESCTVYYSCDCETVENDEGEEVRSCDICTEPGQKYSVTYSAEVQDVTMTFELKDAVRQVIDSEADEQSIEFVFEYFHTIN